MQVRLISWSDASTGLGDGTVDVAFVWLPLAAPDVEARVCSASRAGWRWPSTTRWRPARR